MSYFSVINVCLNCVTELTESIITNLIYKRRMNILKLEKRVINEHFNVELI